MISLNNISLRRGNRLLLQEVNWTIYQKQHIGLIGANGSGKTSLFTMLLGELQPDVGELELPRKLKIAHVAQETPAYSKSALEYVLEGDQELQELQKQLEQAEINNDGHQIATLHARLGEIDAYTAPSRAASLLSGLSFSQNELQQAVSDFSGGWRVRLNLAKALMSRSDMLLLDEPTNHLDLDAVIWLEKWLQQYHGTLILISHDREFLDKTVDHIAHIQHQSLKLYTGNYSTFEKLQAEAMQLQQAAYEKQQKKVAHLQSFINRFKAKASKARQAQSRVKALARLELVNAVQVDSPFQFHFKKPDKCPTPLLKLDEAVIQYGDKLVLSDLEITITPNDRIALLGPNGAGKSSLIRCLAGEVIPRTGVREVSAGLNIGYFAQHQVDHLDLTATPLELMRDLAPNTKEQELRSYLGTFGFSDNRVHETITKFSGGEKSRLALALIIWKKPNLLLLDEPTNHLDLEMRHALSLALQEYQGAMILVSHDRFLVRTTVDQLMLVANGKLAPFEGDINEYEQWLFQFRKNVAKEAPSTSEKSLRKNQRQLDALAREDRKPLLYNIKKLENDLEKIQKNLILIETKLNDQTLYDPKNKEQLQNYILEQATLQKQIVKSESAWLLACQALEIHDKK